jgi:hypothetical protein
MMELHRQAAGVSGAHQQTLVDSQMRATDAEIDRLVYGLYGLTDDEISIYSKGEGPSQSTGVFGRC